MNTLNHLRISHSFNLCWTSTLLRNGFQRTLWSLFTLRMGRVEGERIVATPTPTLQRLGRRHSHQKGEKARKRLLTIIEGSISPLRMRRMSSQSLWQGGEDRKITRGPVLPRTSQENQGQSQQLSRLIHRHNQC